jgi:ketol-acid reductoisomerase
MSNPEETSIRCFTSKDAAPGALAGERITVLGYGNLGQPFALNLRDSGVSSSGEDCCLVVGNIPDEYTQKAQEDGFIVLPIGQATARADIILVLLPDEVIPEAFTTEIAPNLSPGSAIVFASGYTLAYGLIEPPPGVDVLLLAPRMGGEIARQRFLNQQGFHAYVSVEKDASGKAWRRLIGLADAGGVLRAGALELSAQKEANLDLLVEQTIGAAIGVSIMNAFALGVQAGIPPEAMVMEMYISGEMETVWRAFREKGFVRSSGAHGPTAMYGGYLKTMQLMQSDLPTKFNETWQQIQNGEFARQFQAERDAGYPTLSVAQAMSTSDDPITQAEKRLHEILDR